MKSKEVDNGRVKSAKPVTVKATVAAVRKPRKPGLTATEKKALQTAREAVAAGKAAQKMVTVAQLIAKLQKEDPTAIVCVCETPISKFGRKKGSVTIG